VDGVVEIKPRQPAAAERHITYKCTRVSGPDPKGRSHGASIARPPAPPAAGRSRQPDARSRPRLMVGWEGVQVYSKDGEFRRLEGLEHLLSQDAGGARGRRWSGMTTRVLEPSSATPLTRPLANSFHRPVGGAGNSWKRTWTDKVPFFGKLDFEFTVADRRAGHARRKVAGSCATAPRGCATARPTWATWECPWP